MTEEDLAAETIVQLRENGWNIYQEISPKGGYTLDILAEQAGIFMAFEVKLSMNISVLSQAVNWKPYVHYSFAVVPDGKIKHSFWRHIGQTYGVGFLEIRENVHLSHSRLPPYTFYEWGVIGLPHGKEGSLKYASPFYNRRPNLAAWKRFLKPEYQDMMKAGTRGGAKVTPFRDTVLQLEAVVRESPGIELPELLSRVRSHWKTPRGAYHAVIKYVQSGVIKGISIENKNGSWVVYPK